MEDLLNLGYRHQLVVNRTKRVFSMMKYSFQIREAKTGRAVIFTAFERRPLPSIDLQYRTPNPNFASKQMPLK